ncbi:MAG: PASTA domain-containing protein [Prevotella sp.]|nr:PASTA domain-containing protein [Prevotella sp.]
MKAKEFFGKFASGFLWGNLLAMAVVIILLAFGVKYGLEIYTHHGEGIEVPKVEGMLYANARSLVEESGLRIIVSDSGYNKRLAADCVLAQNPGPGTNVKEGHTVYVTINTPSSPSFAIPDVVDNSSYREAEAKLMALGFKLLPPQRVSGEKDWVYGILCRGRRVSTGDRISIDAPLTLMIGSGQFETEEELDDVEPEYKLMLDNKVDEFEEIVE